MKKLLLLCALFIVSASALTSFAAPPDSLPFRPASNEVPSVLPRDNLVLPSDVSYKYSLDIVVSGEKTGKSKADLVFILDTTGSMWSYIRRVKNNIINFSKALAKSDIDARFAVVDYRDIYEDGMDSTKVKEFITASGDTTIWTSDAEEFERMIDTLTADGGGDIPETPTDAMQKFYDMAVRGDKSENLFRGDAVRFALILTDADSKYQSTGWDMHPEYPPIPTLEDMTVLFKKDSIYTTIVSEPYYDREGSYYYQPDYHNLYTQTGGKYIDINDDDYSVIFDIIVNILNDNKDTDGDGLLDKWEKEGMDTDGDGTVDVDLPAMGATAESKDMFIYYDWMEKPLSNNYAFKIPFNSAVSLKPSAEALEIVRQQFLAHGIRVHFIEGKALPYESVFDLGEGLSNWNRLVTENFPTKYWNIARYCVFVNTYKHGDVLRSTGVAENSGQFFIIAQGLLSGNTIETASVFMHKLGHTLGLKDGGDDRDSFKPNYLSVMNWLYMTSGLVSDTPLGKVNYSEYVLPSMDVKAVREVSGIDPLSVTVSPDFKLGAKWLISGTKPSSHQTPSAVAGAGIDFNADGRIGTETSAVDFYIVRSSSDDIIAPSVNDWNRISIKAGRIGGTSAVSGDEDILLPPAVEPYLAEDITIDELEELDIRGNSGDCTIKSVTPTVFFAGVEGQKTAVTVRNLFSLDTSADVSMTLNGETSSGKYAVPGSKTAVAEFPVSSTLEKGIYPAKISLLCANGRSEDKTVYITVTSADPIVITEGESKDLDGDAFNAYAAKVDNEDVAVISDGRIFGLKSGDTFISFTEEGGNVAASIPVKVKEKAIPVIAPTIITASIASADEGKPYDASFTAMGTAPIKWSIEPDVSSYGLTFTESGDLSGVPSKSGLLTFTVTAANSAGTDSRDFTLNVIPKPVPPVITTETLIDASEDVSYDVQLTASGTDPIKWSWSGAIPKGLSFSSTGKLEGVPTVAGDYTFTVTAYNIAGIATKDFTLTVRSVFKGTPPSIVTEAIQNVKAGEPYSFQLEATGTGPLSWTAVFPASLKKELSISEKGLLTGVPSTAGSYRIVVTAKNSWGSDSKTFMLSVYSDKLKAPSVATSKLPDAFIDTYYKYQLEATDGIPELWTITKGELPKGLEFDENTGEISGTIETTKAKTFSFTVVVSNDAGESKPKALKIKVLGKEPSFKTEALKVAKWHSSYNMTIKLSNMKATTWNLTGDLPDGITFKDGKLSGKPNEVGEFEFTVTASNGAVEIEQDFDLVVKGIPPKLKGSLKSGQEGKEYNCVLKATGTTPIAWDFDNLPEGLDFKPDETGETCTISGTPEKAFADKIFVYLSNGSGDDDSITKSLKMTIKAVKPKFKTKAKDIPAGKEGEEYECQLELSASPVNVKWSYTGEMPEGLTLDDGLIYGTPEEHGTFKFTVTAEHAEKSSYKATLKITLKVAPADESDVPAVKEPKVDVPAVDDTKPEFVNGVAYYERGELTAEMLARVSNADEIIVAVLPAIEVDEAGMYEFTVELDEDAPEGATLVWHSFPDGEDDENDKENAIFLDADNEVIENVPASHSVTVSAWLEPGFVYEPVIAVKLTK